MSGTTQTYTASARAEDNKKGAPTINARMMTNRQIGAIVALSVAGGALAGAYVSGKISFGFGQLSGIECTQEANARLVESPRDDVAVLVFKDDISKCVRATGFPAFSAYAMK